MIYPHRPIQTLFFAISWLRFVLPQMRFHLIHSRDQDRAPHDHPWAFRSIVLRGIFREMRFSVVRQDVSGDDGEPGLYHAMRVRCGHLVHGSGETYRMELGDFHRIVYMFHAPVLTLCVFGGRQAVWGFLDPHGVKVPWRTYLGLPDDAPEGSQP